MDPQNIPKRPLFWFNRRSATNGYPVILFDRINLIYIGVFVLLSFVIFWPIIAKITFEEVFFTPLVPFLISVLSIFGFNADSSLRFLFIGSLMISTVGIYLFVYDLTKRRVTAILASVLYLIPPMPIFILSLFFSGRYQSQLISAKSFFTIIYGDGAHFLALALIAFAALFFLRYIKSDKTSDLVITVLACAFILLASRSPALSLFLVFIGTSDIPGPGILLVHTEFLAGDFDWFFQPAQSQSKVSIYTTCDYWLFDTFCLFRFLWQEGRSPDNLFFLSAFYNFSNTCRRVALVSTVIVATSPKACS